MHASVETSGPSLILGSQEATDLRGKLKRRMPLMQAFNQRCARRRLSLAQSESHCRSVERQIDDLHRQLDALQNRDDELIRIVGHRRPGHHLFKALLVNRHVQTAVREGRTHGLLDSSWARSQHVEIWASGLPDVKASLNGRFPMSMGFVVIETIQPRKPP